jgi:hypothetical protein
MEREFLAMGDIKSWYDNPKALLKLVREIAKESGSVHIPLRSSGHIVGDVGVSLIFATLEHGRLSQQHPDPDAFGNQICAMSHVVAGAEIELALAVDVQKREIHILHVEG